CDGGRGRDRRVADSDVLRALPGATARGSSVTPWPLNHSCRLPANLRRTELDDAGDARVLHQMRLPPFVVLVLLTILCSDYAHAEVRGFSPTGMNEPNAGITHGSGLTCSNLFIFNARDELKGSGGEVVETGTNAVMLDLNTFVWVSRKDMLGGAKVSAAAT